MLRYLSRASIRNKRVLLRVDFNVPMSRNRVLDDFRVKAALPTIRALLCGGNEVVIMSHHSDRKKSLRPVAGYLEKALGKKAAFLGKFPERGSIDQLRNKNFRVFILENLRFWPGEEREDLKFAEKLAGLGDVFVNDAFGAAHRRAASITVLPRLLPSFLGLLFEKEMRRLDRFLLRPRRPLLAIFGGAKIETKIPLLKRFSRLADAVAVGGAIANVLLKARGQEVGRSPVGGAARQDVARIARAKNLILPVDVVVASSAASRRGKLVSADAVGESDIVLDIGPKTAALIAGEAARARTVIWNGPLGLIEVEAFAQGTLAVARALARRQEAVTLGGGDSVALLDKAGLLKKFKNVSTGGGAMLAYLAGQRLPALEALRARRKISFYRTVEADNRG